MQPLAVYASVAEYHSSSLIVPPACNSMPGRHAADIEKAGIIYGRICARLDPQPSHCMGVEQQRAP